MGSTAKAILGGVGTLFLPKGPKPPSPPPTPPSLSSSLANNQQKIAAGAAGQLGGTYLTSDQSGAVKTTGGKTLLGQ